MPRTGVQVIRRAMTPSLAMKASLSYLDPFVFPFSSSSAEGGRGLSSFLVGGGRRRVEVVVAEGRCRIRV